MHSAAAVTDSSGNQALSSGHQKNEPSYPQLWVRSLRREPRPIWLQVAYGEEVCRHPVDLFPTLYAERESRGRCDGVLKRIYGDPRTQGVLGGFQLSKGLDCRCMYLQPHPLLHGDGHASERSTPSGVATATAVALVLPEGSP